MEPFSLAIGITGLLSLAGSVSRTAFGFISDMKSYPEEFSKLISRTTEMYGILSTIKPVIERLDDVQNDGRAGDLNDFGS
jgi:hypothetical protein